MTATNLSVERALIILRHLSHTDQGMGIRELSRELGISPAGVQKIINALHKQGFVAQNEEDKRYTLGPDVLQIGLAMLSRLEVRRVAHPFLASLAEATGETAFLGIRDGDDVFYIDKVLPDTDIRMDATLGLTRPYNCTAVGKMILAHLPAEDLERLIAGDRLVQATVNSITDPARLADELETIRQRGYALDCEEFKPGVSCVAAPIHDHNGQLVAAITVAGPAGRIEANLDPIIEQVLAKSHAISTQLGYNIT